jgi:hypothetical protein
VELNLTSEWESELVTNLQLEFDLEPNPIPSLYRFSFYIFEEKLCFLLTIIWLGMLDMFLVWENNSGIYFSE